MWKLKLRWVLPIGFLCLSAGEMIFAARLDALTQPLRAYVGRVNDVWHALNAPALFFLAVAIHYAPIRLPGNFPHIWFDIVLFLTGGVILWFVVGSILDTHKQSMHPKVPTKTIRAAQLFVALWGIYLCFQGLHAISATDYLGRRVPGTVLDGALVMFWSLILIILPARSLTRAAHSRTKPPQATLNDAREG